MNLKTQFLTLVTEIEKNLQSDYETVKNLYGKTYKKQLAILKSDKLKWLIIDIATHYLKLGEQKSPIIYANQENIRVNFFIRKDTQVYNLTIDLDNFLSKNCRVAIVEKPIDVEWDIFTKELELIYAN